jgi:flagellar basal body-associated protein FliL
MKKKGSRKKLIIILIIIVIIIIAAIALYLLISSKISTFSFANQDFSVGADAMDKITEAGNANAFENTKLNPFKNSS